MRRHVSREFVWQGRWQRIGLLTVSALAGLGLLCGIVLADAGEPTAQPDPAAEPEPGRADDASPIQLPAVPRREKLDGALAAIAEAAATTGDDAALAVAESRGLAVSSGVIRVLVESATPDLTGARAAITAVGGTVEAEYADTIQALLPPAGLDLLSASPDVRYVRTPAGRTTDGVPVPGRSR